MIQIKAISKMTISQILRVATPMSILLLQNKIMLPIKRSRLKLTNFGSLMNRRVKMLKARTKTKFKIKSKKERAKSKLMIMNIKVVKMSNKIIP